MLATVLPPRSLGRGRMTCHVAAPGWKKSSGREGSPTVARPRARQPWFDGTICPTEQLATSASQARGRRGFGDTERGGRFPQGVSNRVMKHERLSVERPHAGQDTQHPSQLRARHVGGLSVCVIRARAVVIHRSTRVQRPLFAVQRALMVDGRATRNADGPVTQAALTAIGSVHDRLDDPFERNLDEIVMIVRAVAQDRLNGSADRLHQTAVERLCGTGTSRAQPLDQPRIRLGTR